METPDPLFHSNRWEHRPFIIPAAPELTEAEIEVLYEQEPLTKQEKELCRS